MCTFHLQGHCGRGSACTYAHGPHELRHRPAHTVRDRCNDVPIHLSGSASHIVSSLLLARPRASSCTRLLKATIFYLCALQRNGASGYSTPSSIESVEARENGLNGRELSGKMAALRMNADTIEEDEAPDSFCCPITHVRGNHLLPCSSSSGLMAM